MVERIDQGLAVVLAKIRRPELIACERKNDLGLDAYASASLALDDRGKGLARSKTGTLEKIKADAAEIKKSYFGVSILLFHTPKKVSQPKNTEWRFQPFLYSSNSPLRASLARPASHSSW